MANVTKKQAADYIRGLVKACGPSPSIIDATNYTRSTKSSTTPADAIRAFGANDWNGVMTAYGRYLAANKDSDKESSPEQSSEKEDVPIRHGHYTREYLLRVIKDLYDEFDGYITVQKIRERAKRVPTPSYTVLSEQFGPPRYWAQLVESGFYSKKCRKIALEISENRSIELAISSPELSEPIIFRDYHKINNPQV